MSQLDQSTMSRRQQFAETFRITREADPQITWKLLGLFVAGAVVGALIGWVLPPSSGIANIVWIVLFAVLIGLIPTLILFSRSAQRAAYARIAGQPGAAAAALNMLRRGWTSMPAVALDKNQDIVHRVVGPPGVVLVGEGPSASRLRALLTSERTKTQRVLGDYPVHTLVVGEASDETPLPKLTSKVMKMKRQVAPAEITDILNRLKALDSARGTLPLPKGPVPTSMKGFRGNLRGR